MFDYFYSFHSVLVSEFRQGYRVSCFCSAPTRSWTGLSKRQPADFSTLVRKYLGATVSVVRNQLTAVRSAFFSFFFFFPQRPEMSRSNEYIAFPLWLSGKESTCNAGDVSSIHWSGRSPGEGNGNPLQYSCLKKSHGQRSLASYNPWVTKESEAELHDRMTKQQQQ